MEIAVIGIACRYPGANSAQEFFENILAGRRNFREVPPERWKLADYYDPDRSRPDKTYCRQMAVLEGFEFNPSAFRIPQTTYRATDLSQWLALTVAKEALEDADISDPPRTSTAVILGNTLTGETSRAHLVRYRWPYARRVIEELLDSLGLAGEQRRDIMERVEERYKKPFPPVNEDNLAGGLANTIAGRICNYFDFKGGGYIVDGACSSSLLSIQEASIGLSQGLCDLALAGGVDMSLDPFELVGFAKVGALSDSDIRVYDQRASGFLPGEGCGIVVLKRLKDAIKDGNRIYSVIRGIGYSSDGRGGITAPSVSGQSLAVDRAYMLAGYSFGEVDLIEGHGTGTPVGDRTELQTFIEAKRRHGAEPAHRCGIGSVKSIIGHTKAAAGVAGFIKATLSVYHRVLPPSMGLGIPNELFNTTPHLYPLMRGARWRGDSGRPFRAAVSSAGFGGINTHITVEAHGSNQAARRKLDVNYLMQSQQNAEMILLAADDAVELREAATTMAQVVKRLSHAEMGDLAAHCARSVSNKPLRVAVVADSAAGMHEKLMRVAHELATRFATASEIDWSDVANGIFMRRAKRVPRVAFLFPGQGAQYLDMTYRMKERFAFVASHWQACDQAVESVLPKRLTDYVFTGDVLLEPAAARERSEALRETSVAQPAIVAASMATTEVLRYLGIEADVVLGHSLGEYTALWCAGALEKAEMLRLVAARGAAMAAVGPSAGSMLSVSATVDKVRELLAEVGASLTIANHNAPMQIVVSGERAALDALAEACALQEIPTTHLEVSGPFHSPLMQAGQDRLLPELTRQRWQDLDRLMISTTTGELVGDAAEVQQVLARQITSPVLYTQAIETALAEHVDVFIDVGPAPVLCGLTRRILGERQQPALASDIGAGNDWTGFLQTIGYCFVAGLPVIPARLFENRFVRAFKWPYQPKFITSPCEFAVEPLALASGPLELTRVSPAAYAAPAHSVAPAAAAAPAVDPKSPESVLDFMRHLIMDRFGYPADLIVPGARLLEDLNLDSIKSAEVIGEAMARVEVHADPSAFMKLTLGEMATRLASQATSSAPEPRSAQAEVDQLPTWVRTLSARVTEEPLPQRVRDLPSGRVVVAAAADDRNAAGLIEQLQSRGLKVELWRQGQSLASVRDVVGCIALLPRPARDSVGGAEALETLGANPFALPDFLLDTARTVCSHFVPARANGSGSSTPFFAAIMRSSTLLGQSGVDDRWDASPAAAAFMKTWYLEHPGCEARVVDMDSASSPAAMTDRLLDELTAGRGYVEAAYTRAGSRHVIEYVPVATALMSPAAAALDASDVLMVTGGAKGITAACVKALLERTPCRVALVGSSPPPASGSTAGNEISATLDALAARGFTAKYYQCDVTDDGAVRACVAQITKDLGAIRGLMHAAGVNVPHRIDDLARPAFHSVLKPKMVGLLYLLRAVDLANLRQLTVFSSVIGASGMPGNCDYAYANAWMGLLLKWLSAHYPRLQCRAFGFSVWDEVGMGARLGSVEGLKRMGISAIPPEQGVERFVELMQRQWRTPELVITARAAGLATLRFADRPVADTLPFAQKVILAHPGVELVCEAALDPAKHRFLLDHNYNGALLFPAVIGMEAMSQVALRCVRVLLHEERPPALENMRFLRPIVVPAEGRSIRIYAQADEPQQDGTLRVRVHIRSSLDGYKSEAFAAECVWRATETVRKSFAPRVWPQALAVDPHSELYGTLFFQGPMFQHVAALHDVSSTHCVAQVRIPPATPSDPATPGPVLGSAAVRDCFLHAIQVCVPEYRILPIGLEALETYGLEGDYAYIVATERMRTDEEFTYDIDVVSEEGRVLEQLRGYRCRIIDNFEDRETLERIARVHADALERQAPRISVTRH